MALAGGNGRSRRPATRRPQRPLRGVAVLLASTAVAGSYLAARTGAGEATDERIRQLLTTTEPARSDRLIGIATDLGSLGGLAGVSGVLAASGHRQLSARVLASGLVAWTAAQSVKPLLKRERPYELGTSRRLVSPPAGSAWPSGHAAVAAAMATAICPELPATRGGRISRVVGVATAVAVGMSRIRVGVHHLTDVVAGLGVGVLSSGVAQLALRRLDRRASRQASSGAHRHLDQSGPVTTS